MNKKTGYPSIDKTHLKDTKLTERHPLIPPVTFSRALDIMFSMQGEHNIVDCLDLRVTSKEFQKDSLVIAKSLLELGLRPKDIVVVSMPNYYQAIPIFKATNMLGAITTYLNSHAEKEEIIDYLNLYDAKIYFTCNQDPLFHEEIKRRTHVENVISMNEAKVNSRNLNEENNYSIGSRDDLDYHELERVSKYQKNIKENTFRPNDDALILYTSGSTGKAKSMVYTNKNLLASCVYLKNSTHVPNPVDGDRRWMNVVPFMYPYGFGASVLQTFLSGREVILCPNLTKDNISTYYKKNPDLIFGSPAHLDLTKDNLPDNQMIPSLKQYVSGGDYLSVSQSHDAIAFFKKHGATTSIYNSSGTGETLGCSTNAMNVPYRPETVGQLVVGPEYIIIDPKCIDEKTKKVTSVKEVKYGEVGILCTRGSHVFKGYYKRDDLTDEVMFKYNGKDYYCTGNVGYLDEDRYFTLVGRASRFFITSTLNKVYCELIQNIVADIDIVDSCAVVPKPSKVSRQEAKAYVVLKNNVNLENISKEELENYIIEKCKEIHIDPETGDKVILKDYEIPASVSFLDSLPRTDSAGKINYELLKSMAFKEAEEELKIEKEDTKAKTLKRN